jgi:hypothetical protein
MECLFQLNLSKNSKKELEIKPVLNPFTAIGTAYAVPVIFGVFAI